MKKHWDTKQDQGEKSPKFLKELFLNLINYMAY